MARSILGLVGLGATLVFAIPVAMLGFDYLVLQGRTGLGAALLVAAGLMIAIEEYVTTPGDLAGTAVEKTVGTVVKSPDDDEK
ncbi:hypothetical protein ACFQMA_10245 [Halosimplex aquaticum]|uniref:Uncharacterized protein n=1 Tax=Halosimplex aquaticum TaxID=3026162 RepID=A0ABD5Y371_9EURY|nr:hypothetical protein [Halosimplex aquaticum]